MAGKDINKVICKSGGVKPSCRASFWLFAKATKSFLAFTLAETLIVMGIIGIVSALTLPNLNSSTGEKEKVAKVKKLYQNLDDAYGRATSVYGPIDEWFVNDADDEAKTKRFAERMTEFMKVSKNCQFGEGCFSKGTSYQPDGSKMDDNYYSSMSGFYMVILADGSSLGFGYGAEPGKRIRVDIDGPNKGKNQIGNDLFDFNIDDEKTLIPAVNLQGLTGNFTKGDAWEYATAWVIQNGNLDYLKCDDLNWETKTSCK